MLGADIDMRVVMFRLGSGCEPERNWNSMKTYYTSGFLDIDREYSGFRCHAIMYIILQSGVGVGL